MEQAKFIFFLNCIMSMENSFPNTQNDYSVKHQDIIPHYQFTRIYQQTGGQAVTIDTSNPESIFELPPKVMNFSRSIIKYTATPTAGGANAANWLFQDCVAGIRQMQLYTRGGKYLCDINNLDHYTKIVLKSDVKKSESHEIDIAGATNNTLYGVVAGALATYKYDQTAADANPSVYRPVYITPSTASNSATPVLNMELPLSQIKNTLLALDKDLYFNEVILLRIVWNPYTSWGFKSVQADPDALTDPVTGAVALAANIAITNLTLKLALESNEIINRGLIDKVQREGMHVVVPYVYGFKYTAAGTPTTQTVTLRLNRANGMHLKKIYHSLFNATETIATRFLNTNINKTNIVSYYTMVDNVRRQQFDVVTANDDDIDYVAGNIKGSVIANCDIYRYNWFVLEKFDEGHDTATDCVDSGLPLDIEHKWDFYATTSAANYNHYSFIVTTKLLSIMPMGVDLT